MKEGWEEKKLSDLYDVRDGTHDSPKYHENGYPLVTSKNLRGGILDMSNVSYISEVDYKAINNRSKVDIGDVLFAMIGTIGNPVYVQTEPNYAIKNMALFKVPSNQSGKFLRYYLLNNNVLLKMQKEAKGTTQKFVSLGYLRNFLIKIPSLSEQQSIVDYLDSAFAKIDAMKTNAEKAFNEAKALFQASLKEMLEPKEGWEEKTLGDIAVDSADGPFGSNLKKEHYTTNKEVRIIQLSNIGEDGWREENTKYTTFDHLQNISRSEVEPNDIVIAKMMPAGRAILCPSHEKKFVLSSDAVKIKLKKGLDTRFVLHSINSPYFRKEVYDNVTGSGRVRTSLTKLRACNIYLPSIAEQQSIVATLDSLKSKVDRLQENFDKISQECDALKQSILRQVFE